MNSGDLVGIHGIQLANNVKKHFDVVLDVIAKNLKDLTSLFFYVDRLEPWEWTSLGPAEIIVQSHFGNVSTRLKYGFQVEEHVVQACSNGFSP